MDFDAVFHQKKTFLLVIYSHVVQFSQRFSHLLQNSSCQRLKHLILFYLQCIFFMLHWKQVISSKSKSFAVIFDGIIFSPFYSYLQRSFFSCHNFQRQAPVNSTHRQNSVHTGRILVSEFLSRLLIQNIVPKCTLHIDDFL